MGFPDGSDGNESACNVGDVGLIPGSGRSLGERNGNPLKYSCLENPMDRGAWRATIHGGHKVLLLKLGFLGRGVVLGFSFLRPSRLYSEDLAVVFVAFCVTATLLSVSLPTEQKSFAIGLKNLFVFP